jgi:transcriptional regulator with XRE-family HTH domain
MTVEGVQGEFRRFTSAEVGMLIRYYRDLRGIKRAALAADANVSEKTIERAEAGEGISEDSCRRIARTLEMKDSLFTDEHYIPTPEEATIFANKEEDERRRTHFEIAVNTINGPRDILPLFRCMALLPDERCVADEHLKDFACIKQDMMGCIDLASDVEETNRVEWASNLTKAIREFEGLGYVVKCAMAPYRAGWTCAVLVVFRKPKGTPGTPDTVWLPRTLHKNAM